MGRKILSPTTIKPNGSPKPSLPYHGFTNGNGLTDGNGLTNGNGLTLSYFSQPKTPKANEMPNHDLNHNHKASVISTLDHKATKNRVFSIILALILILLPFGLYSIGIKDDEPASRIFIDSEFVDWEEYEIYTDTYSDQSNNPNIDLVKYQILGTDKGVAFYIEVDGNIFNGIKEDSKEYPEGISILIDSDSNSNTGYSMNDIGAEYLIDLRGANSQVIYEGLFAFVGDRAITNDDWSGWVYKSNVAVGTDNCRLEGEAFLPSIIDSNDISSLIITRDKWGNQDISDNIINPSKQILSVNVNSELPDVVESDSKNLPIMTIKLENEDLNKEPISIDSFTFKILGTAPIESIGNLRLTVMDDGSLSNIVEEIDTQPVITGELSDQRMSSLIGSYVDNKPIGSAYDPQPYYGSIINGKLESLMDGSVLFKLDEPIIIESASTNSFKVVIDISPTIIEGTTIGLELIEISSQDSIITYNHATQNLAYLGSIPQKIRIDGAFGDWHGVEKYPDQDGRLNLDPNFDVQDFAMENNNERFNFYFRTFGELLVSDGLAIQLNPINDNLMTETITNNIKPVTQKLNDIPAEFIPKNTLKIFLDTDQNISTGFIPTWLPVGAEFMIEVSGRNGRIYDSSIFRYDPNNNQIFSTSWSWEFLATIPAVKDISRLETAVNFEILGLESALGDGVNICYILTNWDNSISDTGDFWASIPKEGSISFNSERLTRANNPYGSNHLHPINATSDNSVQPDYNDLDENSPGDAIFEKSGSDPFYSWIECGYESTKIPIISEINNLTIYMGYKCDPYWNLTTTHKGIIWSTTNDSTEHNISDYNLTTSDADEFFTTTTDLPTPMDLNHGIYIRINGKDEDGGSKDYFELDYLYFTINYSIPNIVINEVMFDPTGDDNSSEWIELYNAGETAVDLTGWNLTDNEGNKFILTSAGTIQPGEYLVCYIAQSGVNSSTDIYGNILFENVIQPNATEGKDNYLDESSLNGNYGSNSDLDVINALKDLRPLVQFNLSKISQNGILSSKIWLYRYDGNLNNDAEISVHRIISSWTEEGSCWNTYDGSNDWPVNNNGGDWNETVEDSTIIVGEHYGWYSWDITNLTKNWKNATYPNFGIIFLNSNGDPGESFYSSDYSINANLRPKLVVDYWSSSKTMLDNNESLTLIDQYDNIVDYVAWGADPGADDDLAVAVGQWSDGAFVNTSNLAENETLARNKDSTDTDTTSDWENSTTNKAAPYGINATIPTPGAQNSDVIIPEYDFLILPIMLILVIIILFNGKGTQSLSFNKNHIRKKKRTNSQEFKNNKNCEDR